MRCCGSPFLIASRTAGLPLCGPSGRCKVLGGGRSRSEEHTSELQSLMRISYAVFCLKKKKQKTSNKTNIGIEIKNNTNRRSYNIILTESCNRNRNTIQH